jgi:hypothetical protein
MAVSIGRDGFRLVFVSKVIWTPPSTSLTSKTTTNFNLNL